MRRVVTQLFGVTKKVTLEWLIKEKACIEGIEWFYKNFGLEASFNDVLEAAIEKRDLHDRCHYDVWLIENKSKMTLSHSKKDHLKVNKNRVPIEALDEKKVYLMDYSSSIYKLHKFQGYWYWMGFKNSYNGFKRRYTSMEKAILSHINKKSVKIYEVKHPLEIRERKTVSVTRGNKMKECFTCECGCQDWTIFRDRFQCKMCKKDFHPMALQLGSIKKDLFPIELPITYMNNMLKK